LLLVACSDVWQEPHSLLQKHKMFHFSYTVLQAQYFIKGREERTDYLYTKLSDSNTTG
jgi:hypothetical protein